MSPDEYAKTLQASVFTLCPKGHSVEQYRIYEALEAGSIPVLELHGDYLRTKLPPEYFVSSGLLFVESWSDAPAAMQKLVMDQAALDARQQQISKWYTGYMRSKVDEIEHALENIVDPLDGSVC